MVLYVAYLGNQEFVGGPESLLKNLWFSTAKNNRLSFSDLHLEVGSLLVSLRFQKHPPQTIQTYESLRRRDGWFWKIDLLENWSRFFVQLKRSKPRKGRKTMTLRNRHGCFGYHFPFIKACNPKDPTLSTCCYTKWPQNTRKMFSKKYRSQKLSDTLKNH